jgi:hypothetical protein
VERLKIKLECWWSDALSLHNRFIKQFVEEKDSQKYEFVLEDQDFTVVFGRTNWDQLKTPKEKTFYISQEPLWSPNQPKDGIHEYCSKILISDRNEYPNRAEYIETLLPMFYAGRGEIDSREDWDWSLKIKDKNFKKTKPISIVVRKDYCSHWNHLSNPNTNTINYIERTNLGIELSKNELIDIYGTYWENNGKNIKGEVWNKHVALDEYFFSIGCENTIQKNYISEKFWDIVLTDSIPIYLGCNNILEYIPENCFINLNGMKIEEMVLRINDILNNYQEYYNFHIPNIRKLKEEFFSNSDFNLWERIKKLISEN